MTEPDPIRFELDGEPVEVRADPLAPLSTVIATDLGKRQVVEPCGVGACGACTVLVDKSSVLACLTPTGSVDGCSVTTIAGVPEDDAVVAAYVDASAFQCGYCIPGFVLATQALRQEGTTSDREQVVAGLAGNLCRCSSYVAIIDAAWASLDDRQR